MDLLNIDGILVGPGQPPYVIAEIGSNHNGDMSLCRELIDTAKRCGAQAVKFQSWSKTSIASRAEYARRTYYADKERHFGTLEEMVERYQLTEAQHHEIAAYSGGKGITFLSSCFSRREVDILLDLNISCFKIASMDINHFPLLRYVGKTGRPVVLSTGMASLGEIERALTTLRDAGAGAIALLHCISIYPPPLETIHLRNIVGLQQAFQVPTGFSDHSIGISIPLAAIALGACIIEKHFTIDKALHGWDHAISADPPELEAICREGLNIFRALGSYQRTVRPAEMEKRKIFRRRAVVTRAVHKGEQLTEADLDFKRPGTGIHPDEAPYVIGRTVERDLEADDELEWSDLR